MSDPKNRIVSDLSHLTGMTREGINAAWEEAKLNSKRLKDCPRHLFEPQPVKIGLRLTCMKCQGLISLSDVGHYIQGYEAAGGSADDIWPGYRKKSE